MRRTLLGGAFAGSMVAGFAAAMEAAYLMSQHGLIFGVVDEGFMLLGSFLSYVAIGTILGAFVALFVHLAGRAAPRWFRSKDLAVDTGVLVVAALLAAGYTTHLKQRVLTDRIGLLDPLGLLILLGVVVGAGIAFVILRWPLIKLLGALRRRGIRGRRVAGAAGLFLALGLVALTVAQHLRTAAGRVIPPRGGVAAVSPTREMPNVVLITLDTVRAKSLGLYGYERETAPRLTELARSAVVYEKAATHAAWTLPSHEVLFTGRYPSELSADWGTGRLSSSAITLAEVLKAAGYSTGAVVAGPYCSSVHGLAQGFDYYEDNLPVGTPFLTQIVNRLAADFFSSVGKRRAGQNNEFVFRWLDENYKRPFFMFINYFDAHSTLNPILRFSKAFEGAFGPIRRFLLSQRVMEAGVLEGRRPLSQRERDHWLALYDCEILSLDYELDRLVSRLKDLGVYENTILVITSDHGHSFGEHDLAGHGGWLFGEVADVPLIIRYPNGRDGGRRVVRRTGLVELYSKILGEIGVPLPETAHPAETFDNGVVVLENSRVNRLSSYEYKYAGRDVRVAYQGEYKMVDIDGVPAELYNLEADPGELVNLIDAEPGRARLLADALAHAVGGMLEPMLAEDRDEENDEQAQKLIKQLRAVGYIR
ncbi:MAG: sulfatase [Candidatus Krumholzibacteriia bacterium]